MSSTTIVSAFTLSITLICTTVFAQENSVLTPAQAQENALELAVGYDRPFKFLYDLELNNLARTLDKYYAKRVYRTGEPFLTYELKASDALLYSDEVKTLCLESNHLMGMNEERNETLGLEACIDRLRGRDTYEIPIFNRHNDYLYTTFVDVEEEPGSGGGGIGTVARISAAEAKKLAGTQSEPKLYSFNIPTDFEPYNDDYLEGRVNYWLTDGLAVHPDNGEVFKVMNLEGEPVDLLRGEIQPYVEQRNWLGMYGEDVMPLLLFPVKLEPVATQP